MTIGATETTLHAVWDTNVVASLGDNPDQVASELEAQITPEEEKSWSAGTSVDWANELFRVAKHVIYSSLHGEGGTTEPIFLPADYAARERPITATQLERAGVRLAAVLNGIVSTDDPPCGNHWTRQCFCACWPNGDGQGHCNDVHTTRSGITFIDMGGRYPRNSFTAVIFAENAGNFPSLVPLWPVEFFARANSPEEARADTTRSP